jgi:3-hydroxyisobutyrate dehydrogenase-like beta-hydroxyacid dehydrogenase
MDGDQVTSLGGVGVGRMSRPLDMRLLAAGHKVGVYNRTRRERAADVGATLVDSPAKLADRDVVFTIVADAARLGCGVGTQAFICGIGRAR